MTQITDEARYRVRLAEGFLQEAQQDMTLQRWRSCVDNSQLSVENAAKAALALLGPVGRTHNPSALLRRALADNRYPQDSRVPVERLAECAELLGPDIHIESDYGNEASRQTPWELFGQDDAHQALGLAAEAVRLAQQLTQPPAPQEPLEAATH